MKTYDLTENELLAALALVKSCLAGMGGKRPSDLERDPYTWVEASDLVTAGWITPAANGTFGALLAKGVIGGEYNPHQCETYLEDDAWRWLDTIWDDREKMESSHV
jgi:hypothetical protein